MLGKIIRSSDFRRSLVLLGVTAAVELVKAALDARDRHPEA